MSDLASRLFGPFEIAYNGEPLTHFRTSKTQALLVYLLVEAHTAHKREALMTMLWPDLSPESAQTNLRQVVYQLRKAIPATPGRHNGRRVPFLLSDRQTVQVNPDADYAVDVADFAAATSAVRAHAHSDIRTCPTCRERLAHAADLHRGDFLAGFYLEDSNAFEEWAARRRETYRRAAGHAMHTLAAVAMLRGDHEQAQVYARRQLDLDGLDERAYRQLME